MSEWCKFKQARLWNAGTGTGVSTGGRAHSPRVSVRGPRSPTRVQVFVLMLGHVHDGQPTVILRVSMW